MPVTAVRLLPERVADGPWNMAADDTLLHSAASGKASLRFYRWSVPTLSLGYFQPSARVISQPALSELAWLRRPSGGEALVHHHEWTYALALPADRAWLPPGESWIGVIHQVFRDLLRDLGVPADLCTQDLRIGDHLCFLHHTPGDLILAGHKIAGSAQRKLRGALLQHGGLLLAQSQHTPALPGLAELHPGLDLLPFPRRATEAIGRFFSWDIHPDDWSDEEQNLIQQQLEDRYLRQEWNFRR
ncbi:MAG: biotin/lipoate A/B protein ligase family protein [Gemmataceae bacterium]